MERAFQRQDLSAYDGGHFRGKFKKIDDVFHSAPP
jgi:hypothetical protein